MQPNTPEIIKLPKRTVLTVTTTGAPNRTAPLAMRALYGAAYSTKFKVYKPKKKEMKIGAPSACWPDAHTKPKSQWTAIWDLEVPAFVKQRDVVQKDPAMQVNVATRKAGMYGQILHVGAYDKEEATVALLHGFLRKQRMKVAGPHEEVYLSRPGPKAKTVIRYLVRQAKR